MDSGPLCTFLLAILVQALALIARIRHQFLWYIGLANSSPPTPTPFSVDVLDLIAQYLINEGNYGTCANLNMPSYLVQDETRRTLWRIQPFAVKQRLEELGNSEDWLLRSGLPAFTDCCQQVSLLRPTWYPLD